MVNPFDRTFFQLMLGFSLILSFSFAILFFVGRYSANLEEQEYAVVEKAGSLDK
jgi:hypothetical protein